MPAALDTCFFLNSASEANELALRLSQAATGHRDTIIAESAYHGHSTTLIDISPYKHNRPGPPDWVHTVPIPDTYRGTHRNDDAASNHAQAVGDKIAHLQEAGKGLAAFIAETYPSVGGQIIPPDGYLSEVYQHVRNAGGLCIADEGQTGYGRIGNAFYAFEQQGVGPDIDPLSKPIGNRHPLAALITRRDIAETFDNDIEFFSTFGGSMPSYVIGKKVLKVTQRAGLQSHARVTGDKPLERFNHLKRWHPLIGDIRGCGLFLGIEPVKHRDSLEPTASEPSEIADVLVEAGILIGIDRPHHKVLKIRPPMPFDDDNAKELVTALDQALECIQS
jgi:4-aminobutyrate aminotransferase-like enzyme